MTLEIEKNKDFPNILKFIAKEPLIEGSFQFDSPQQAKISPLASQLFEYSFVEKVFMASHFILLEKNEFVNWQEVEEELREAIIRFLQSGTSLIYREDKQEGSLEIYIESTPNPEVLKFGLSKTLSEFPIEIKSSSQVYKSPLAEALFKFPFVKEVFIYGKVLSITKHPFLDWEDISSELKKFLLSYFSENKKIIHKEFVADPNFKQSQIEKEIEAFLDEYINPMVAKDGGNIKILSFDESIKTLKVLLQGACSGCPSSSITLKEGIESALRAKFPDQVAYVEAINS